MRMMQFLSLSTDDQLEWIENNLEDYEVLLYEDRCYLGSSYPTATIDLNLYFENRDEYGTVHLILQNLPDISDTRLEELYNGAKLNEREIEALIAQIAENDVDGWLGHHYIELTFEDATCFAHFESESIGQGGLIFEYRNAYASKNELKKHFVSLPFAGVAQSFAHVFNLT